MDKIHGCRCRSLTRELSEKEKQIKSLLHIVNRMEKVINNYHNSVLKIVSY